MSDRGRFVRGALPLREVSEAEEQLLQATMHRHGQRYRQVARRLLPFVLGAAGNFQQHLNYLGILMGSACQRELA